MITKRYKEQEEKKLNNQEREELLAQTITQYENFKKDLDSHKKAYETIKRHVFDNLLNEDEDKFLLTKVYEQRETFKAHLKHKCCPSIDALFGIEGNTLEDDKNAKTQKSFIEHLLEKMDYLGIYDQGLESFIDKGEFITFTDWQEEYAEVKRDAYINISTGEVVPPGFPELQELLASGAIEKTKLIQLEKKYDGPKSIEIDPFELVFHKDKVKDWDSCPKIYPSWKTYEEIIACENYEISSETKKTLEEIAKNNGSLDDNSDKDFSEEAFNDDLIEVLEYWGDLRLPDGTFLKNWHYVTIGRLEIVRFEKNPYLINPFKRCTFAIHPTTKRGIAPLLVACLLNEKSSKIFRGQLDILELIKNPFRFLRKGVFKGGKIQVKPGGTAELDDQLGAVANPILGEITGKEGLIGFDRFLPEFENNIESATGISKYHTGDPTNSGIANKTATAAQGVMNYGDIRFSNIVENINKNLTRDTIENIAKLQSNLASENATIKVRKNGQIEFEQVTPAVMMGNYEYKVSDAKKKNQQKAKAELTLQLLEKIVQDPEVDNLEVYRYGLREIAEIQDTEQFFIKDPLQKALNQFPEEQKKQVKEFLLSQLQGVINGSQI